MPSTYFSRLNLDFRSGFRRLIIGKQGGLDKTVGFLFAQGNFLLGDSGLSTLRPFSSLGGLNLLLRPGTIFAARSDLRIAEQKSLAVFVGALSRTFSIPSVSGPSCQVCGYHIDRLLSDSTQLSLRSPSFTTTMAACGSRVVLGDRCIDNLTSRNGHLLSSFNRAGLSCSNRRVDCCRKTSMSLRNQEPSNSYQVYGYFMFDIARRSCNSHPLMGSGSKYFHGSSSACYSFGTAPDVSFDGSAREEQSANSAVSTEQYANSPGYFS